MKLKDWLSVWLEKYTKHTVKLRTYDRYKYIIEKHINPKLGDYDLDDLNGEIFQDFVLSELEKIARTQTQKKTARFGDVNNFLNKKIEKIFVFLLDNFFCF